MVNNFSLGYRIILDFLKSLTFLRSRSYVSVTLTHFCVDIMNSGRTLLVAILAVQMALSNQMLGLLLLFYNLGSALSQPLFGLLADRFGARWLVIGGLGWMILFYSLGATLQPWPALLAVTVASLGSGAFHPSGTKVASEISDLRRTQATAVFFMSGQVGLFVGPILAGGLMELYARPGYLVLPLLSTLALATGWRWLARWTARTDVESGHEPARPATHETEFSGRTLLLLVAIIVAIQTVTFAALNFAPKLFTELGFAPAYVGWVAGLFMLGAAAGGIVGGTLADRVGGRPVILLALLGAVVPLYLYVPAGDLWRLFWLLAAGFFAGMPHSILVLNAQALLPDRRALASGLTLGFMFFSGAIGSYILGIVADYVGLAVALQGAAVLPLLVLPAALFLPRRKRV